MSSPVIEEDISRIGHRLGASVLKLAGKRVLITGSRGYLAAYICDTLAWLNDHILDRPCQILALMREPKSTAHRLSHLVGREDVAFIFQDVVQPIDPDLSAEFIIHAASKASPIHYLADPLGTVDANVGATRTLLELARGWNSESLLFFSTGEIYGDPQRDGEKIGESHPSGGDPLAPRGCYVESKRMGETLCAIYHRELGIPVKIVRPFHVYGPGLRLDDGRVIAEFLAARLAGRSIEALGDGSGVRAFCYIEDATFAFLGALLSGHDGEVFNVGNDREPISIRLLAETLAALEEPKLTVRLEVAPDASHLVGAPSAVCPDVTKARRLLGFEPEVPLADGLRRTLQWYRDQSEAVEPAAS